MSDETNERYRVRVNGHAVEPGCWVDGHWGQYGPDHLADRAEELGWSAEKWIDDPRVIRDVIGTIETWGYPRDASDMASEGVGIVATLWECHTESADDIEAWLNGHTDPMCSHCHQAMYPTSDGFYRHRDYANSRTPCGFAAIDEPVFYRWGWRDGEFYLWDSDSWEENDA